MKITLELIKSSIEVVDISLVMLLMMSFQERFADYWLQSSIAVFELGKRNFFYCFAEATQGTSNCCGKHGYVICYQYYELSTYNLSKNDQDYCVRVYAKKLNIN